MTPTVTLLYNITVGVKATVLRLGPYQEKKSIVIIHLKIILQIKVFSFYWFVLGLLVLRVAEAELRVVTTTTFLADTVQQIGQERVAVRSLMRNNLHYYKIRTEDIQHIFQAQLILYNGLSTENGLKRVFDQLPESIYLIDISACLPKQVLLSSNQLDHHHPHSKSTCNHYDSHFWLNVSHWMAVVQQVKNSLKAIDPGQSHFYQRSTHTYLKQLRELDRYILSQSKKVPVDNRLLITSHNALNYFGQAYGFETDGLMGTEGQEASIANMRKLADKIISRNLTTIFWDNTTSQKSMQALQESLQAKGYKVRLAGPILIDGVWANSQMLADCDKHHHQTYIGMMRHNIDTMLVHLAPALVHR